MKNNVKFLFLALAKAGKGISGSDRIFIELARNWHAKVSVKIITGSEGVELIKIQKLSQQNLEIVEIPNKHFAASFIINYFFKIVYSVWFGLTFKITEKESANKYFLYSGSDFWMDVLPALILKIRFNNLNWVATWFQTAPNPLKGFSEGEREKTYKLSAFLYWFSQLPIKPLINNFADLVIVNNEDEKNRFPVMNKNGKVLVLIGAVRTEEINEYLKKIGKLPKDTKYDAVFQGRFHPQKGVLELVDIWKKVIQKIPSARLAMIGDGPLMEKVKNKITELSLDRNIKLFGYVYDGEKKYEIFSNCKIVLHPAFYDSGGMASAEAMAFGLPCIGFDLKAYESYYPKGMIKVKKGDTSAFAGEIIKLLHEDRLRTKIGLEAQQMIKKSWGWSKRSNDLLTSILKSTS